MSDKKKKIAIIAAVAQYIKSEQEAMVFSQPQVSKIPETKGPSSLFSNLWGISGRQQQMQMRSIMQMKTFRGSIHNI